MLMIFAVLLCYLSSSHGKAFKFRSERDSKPDLCDALNNKFFVLFLLRYLFTNFRIVEIKCVTLPYIDRPLKD